MKTVTFVVCFHTWPWIKDCISCLSLENLVVVNNNPSKAEDIKGWYLGRPDRSYNKFCAAEEEFVKSMGLPVIRPDGAPLKHGQAMDFARDLFIDQGYDVMVHIEPDCIVSGNKWWSNLVGAIEDGYWMSSGDRDHRGYLRPCPSAWNLEKTRNLSFSFFPRTSTEKWDTGLKAWHECHLLGKDKEVEVPDFLHYRGGSWENRHASHPLVCYL